MANDALDLAGIKRRMQGAVDVLKNELSGLRTGRASASLLDPIVVDVYGSSMPLNQLATVSVPEARLISVQVWDRSTAGAVERAIRESSLGLNPVVEGTSMRIPIPELNAERRQELIKVAHKYAEAARVSIRHVRRDGMESLKKLEKDGAVGQDEQRVLSDKVQKLTDESITDVDQLLAHKEKEIAQV
ncbi:ribosome recycling factor [Pseudoxanthobacter soli DSM 19599]|uniref:Ribosome-recycling factor n=1 Tax=Pseudoxanthobacter soli DSM 19599 TaxID=1123029 RepID=A0A1M7ZQF0_9HYPH|nr:ribosome recycling factor [Pseudoxanthobacter soli]SHO67115.1 ribosome recycling factor [Pseudoxanthobacter soli DSM 19599]